MTKTKVLVLTTTFPRWRGDTTPAFVYELSKRLQEKGFEIIVLAPHHRGAKKLEIMNGMKVYRFQYFWPAKYQRLAYGGGILPNLKRSWLARIQLPLVFLAELFYAIRIARKERVDLIHSHWIVPSGLVGAICRKVLRIKHVLTEHVAGLVAVKKLPKKEKIISFICKNSDKITVVSTYVAERLLNLVSHNKQSIERKISIIPMGVDTSIFDQKLDKEKLRAKYGIKSENVLLFIGRLAEKKGVQYLIKAMPKILKVFPSTELIICGDGPLRNNLENLVKEMNLREYIRFTGYISEREKIEYLHVADILVVPSVVTRSGDTEGLPVVILEGLASGKVVVASDVGGIKDVIRDGINGLLAKPGDPEDLAEKIIKLLTDKELRQKLSEEGIKTVNERFSWNVVLEKFSSVYYSVLRDV